MAFFSTGGLTCATVGWSGELGGTPMMRHHPNCALIRVALVATLLVVACGSGTDNLASDDGGAGIDGRVVDFSDASPFAPDAGPNEGCVADGPQCNNCIDDDLDGFVDGFDPECTGAADDDEGSFATGLPGDNRDRRFQDCFFDGNSGAGDDGCNVHTCCLLDSCPADLQNTFDPTECAVTQECINNCSAITPPGCDCFGCCTVCDDVGCVDIYTHPLVAPECTQETIHDPTKCPTCTPHPDCGASCDDPCVLCPGQTEDDLPPECMDNECPNGLSSCNTNADCQQDEFCSNYCCIRVIN